MSDVVKWVLLAGLLTSLLAIGVLIVTDFQPFDNLGRAIEDATEFLSDNSVIVARWRGVLNNFCNPYLLNFGLGIWLFYPLYKITIISAKRIANFFLS